MRLIHFLGGVEKAKQFLLEWNTENSFKLGEITVTKEVLKNEIVEYYLSKVGSLDQLQIFIEKMRKEDATYLNPENGNFFKIEGNILYQLTDYSTWKKIKYPKSTLLHRANLERVLKHYN